MNSMPDMPIEVPVDNPNADTEWNDILRKHGIIPERPPSPTKEIEESIIAAAEQVYADRYELMNEDELDELEDEMEPEFWAQWKATKMNEMQQTKKGDHGSVYPLHKSEYKREVTEASVKFPVMLLMTGDNVQSTLVEGWWRELAARWPSVKFLQIVANMCVEEDYPTKNCPTVLVYLDGELKKRLVGIDALGGPKAGAEGLSDLMVRLGVIGVKDKLLNDEYREDVDRSAEESEGSDFELDLD